MQMENNIAPFPSAPVCLVEERFQCVKFFLLRPVRASAPLLEELKGAFVWQLHGWVAYVLTRA